MPQDSVPRLKPRVQGYRFFSWGEPTYGCEAAQLLVAIQKGKPLAAFSELWYELGYPKAQFFQFPSSRDLPSAIVADAGDLVWVGVNGTDDIAQVIKYADPFAVFNSARVDSKYADHNAQFSLWGDEIVTRLKGYLSGRKPRVAFHGHSYGGAVVTIAASRYAATQGPHMVSCVTFGAPKPGSKRWLAWPLHQFIRRWMNVGDPIPALPPSEGELGVPIPFARKIAVGLLFKGYDSPPGGELLSKDGSYVGGKTTRLTPGLFELLQLDDEASFDPRRFGYHRLREYVERLDLAAYLELMPYGIDFRQKSYTPVSVPPKRLTTPYIEFLRQAAIEEQLRKDNPLLGGKQVIEPSVSPFVPKVARAITQRSGSNWSVNWCELVICVDPSRSRCHSLTKAINKMARRLVVTKGVDIPELVDAVNRFAGLATAGGLFFRPDVADFTL